MSAQDLSTRVVVLVVDDNEDDVLFLGMSLAHCSANCDLRVAQDGPRALAALRGPAPIPQIVLLDLNMPGRGGHEILREIRADDALRGIPVIVLSSSDSPADVREAYRNGANCYLRKPAGLAEYRALALQLDAFWFRSARLPG